MSFPPATEMFQFAGFASRTYGFSTGYPLRGGLPHSDTPGSPIARISPGLFAACHVLHRLSVPRHPPDALHSRLSATPNGKNHRETRGCSRNLAGRTMPRQKPGPTMGRLSAHLRCACRQGETEFRRGIPLSSAGPAKPRRLKTLSGPPTHRPKGPYDGSIPPRSHNSLFTSVHQQPPPAAITAFRRQSRSSCRVSGQGMPPPGFRRNLRFHLSPSAEPVFGRWWR